MPSDILRYTGGCLCGSVRYVLTGAPLYAGFCCCEDCRKASGAGAIPFMGYHRSNFGLAGEVSQARKTLRSGRVATRNFCPRCGSLIFGGDYGESEMHTVYAGTLDDPAAFVPTHAVMTRDRPSWVALPDGLELHAGMPDG